MIADDRSAAGFQAYLSTREAVLRIRERMPGSDASKYWEEELGTIDYLIEASPLIIRKLRHHAFHITNIRPYDYRAKDDGKREHFEARLRALRQLDAAGVCVPESPALGGFGYEIDGALYNVDTLKFYEVLIGMHRAGVLGSLQHDRRATVWEIGAGWGGFAHQFKTLFPNTTYVITDFPELFLFSATYLKTLFPDARVHFCGAGADDDPAGWNAFDFVFVPNRSTEIVSRAAVDLAINMVSFQEMTEAQVREYARLAVASGARNIYSLNRERSPYNTELTSVSQVLAEEFELSEIQVLETEYTSAMKKPPKPGKPVERSPLAYRHLAGTLKAGAHDTSPGKTVRHAGARPPVVLGMTLYNNAGYLREALDSILAQTDRDFRLVMLDDGSDESESIARDYEQRDARVRYFKHEARRAMIATWREVVEIAAREYPDAEYFAWVSDHDRWHPQWLATMRRELDGHRDAVLAYPLTKRIDANGELLPKDTRFFETQDLGTARERFRHFCHRNTGSGDMVYGLMRMSALRDAGIFRLVLRPDKLLMAELALRGQIRQVREVLWHRRESQVASVARQAHTLVLPGEAPRWFAWPPSFQHTLMLHREYVRPEPPGFGLRRIEWYGMLLRYVLSYGWREFRKSQTFNALNNGIDNVIWVRKITMHYVRHGIYDTLMALRAFRGRLRRLLRRTIYIVLVTYHDIVDTLRGRGETSR